ncbi:hypothetical protein M2347_003785 [Chryseobacterium sp. H1D6B]|uniref:hypothetical protein n=1 Tax=Chryseobacterium sp. H1D6B TaxID=2940588 RepID=UPI0015CBF6DE|nr:hypothetical protein [Chryseobacterium sp. H1D6B]MDH6254058.1 hypothetical protein [Chryseobacterium sp. H1D6B]
MIIVAGFWLHTMSFRYQKESLFMAEIFAPLRSVLNDKIIMTVKNDKKKPSPK